MIQSIASEYLFVNTEFLFEATIVDFEFYSSVAGVLYLRVVSFSACGQLDYCYNYFKRVPIYSGINLLKLYIFYGLAQGYNKILFDEPYKVPKGAMIFISQKGAYTARITIDPTRTLLNTDYLVDISNNLIALNSQKNYAFNFNCLINVDLYISHLTFQHTYPAIGYYNMTVAYVSSSVNMTRLVGIFSCKS